GKYPEPLFVIMNDGVQTTWAVSAVKKDGVSFQSRKLFPESWAGKTGGELAKATGVSDANFCHNGRFIVVANSREGALKLAQLAVEA
ncbi:MAG: MYG1 family protein, partial [Candidatus Paceibacterota bacterium]